MIHVIVAIAGLIVGALAMAFRARGQRAADAESAEKQAFSQAEQQAATETRAADERLASERKRGTVADVNGRFGGKS